MNTKTNAFIILLFFHNTQFQSSFTENHDANVYNILLSSCLVAFSRLELGNNIVCILQQCIQAALLHSILPYTIIVCMWIKLDIHKQLKIMLYVSIRHAL